jgi:glutathione S-transferase
LFWFVAQFLALMPNDHEEETSMPVQRNITLFHAPNSRSYGTLLLLEELGVPYTLRVLNMQAGEQRQPAYLAVNPMGKVPAVLDGDALITEQVAIFLHLADRFPEAGLAPPPGDPLRGPYLRWMVFYASCFEPAVIDRALQREAGRREMSPYGDFDTMLATVAAQLARGPWLLGERFSAADVLWGGGLTWTTQFGMVPRLPDIAAYCDRCNARPAVARARARDAELAASQGTPTPPAP